MGGKASLCQADAQQAVATRVREFTEFTQYRSFSAAEPSIMTIAVSVL